MDGLPSLQEYARRLLPLPPDWLETILIISFISFLLFNIRGIIKIWMKLDKLLCRHKQHYIEVREGEVEVILVEKCLKCGEELGTRQASPEELESVMRSRMEGGVVKVPDKRCYHIPP